MHEIILSVFALRVNEEARILSVSSLFHVVAVCCSQSFSASAMSVFSQGKFASGLPK